MAKTRSLGAALLVAWMEEQGVAQVALVSLLEKAGCDVHQTTVGRWIKDEITPTLAASIALREIAKVPVDAWLTPEAKRRGRAA